MEDHQSHNHHQPAIPSQIQENQQQRELPRPSYRNKSILSIIALFMIPVFISYRVMLDGKNTQCAYINLTTWLSLVLVYGSQLRTVRERSEHLLLASHEKCDWTMKMLMERLYVIDLSGKNLTTDDAKSLSQGALQSPLCNLKMLNLSNNKIEQEGIIALATALKLPHCHYMHPTIDFSGNNFSMHINEFAEVMGGKDVINKFSRLEGFRRTFTDQTWVTDLIDKDLIADDIDFLSQAALQHSLPQIMTVDNASKQCAKINLTTWLALVLGYSSQLRTVRERSEHLLLASYEKCDWTIQMLMERLHTIDLSGKGLTDDDATTLSYGALQSPVCNIKTLNLNHNNIGRKGAMALAKALKLPHCHHMHPAVDLSMNSFLKSFDIINNFVIEMGGKKSLQKFSNLDLRNSFDGKSLKNYIDLRLQDYDKFSKFTQEVCQSTFETHYAVPVETMVHEEKIPGLSVSLPRMHPDSEEVLAVDSELSALLRRRAELVSRTDWRYDHRGPCENHLNSVLDSCSPLKLR